ncbi:MAG: NTP transferase domain-containing protein, partial [Clostridiaceae bacterium]|nr:NTP transferase domain-containing protein [Clostridiaceae bacterium]
TRSSIAKIEKGVSDISQSKLSGFANAHNTTVENLMTGIKPEVEDTNKSAVVNSEELSSTPVDTQHSKSYTYAVILAGGKSTRNHQNTPNQFVSVHGKPVILYTLEAYQRRPAINGIYIVCLSGWEGILPAYAEQYGISKLAGIIPAGKTGILSCVNAVEWLSRKCSNDDAVIFQEATRPMVTEDMISNTIRCCQENGSAITFEPMDEYLQFVTSDSGTGVQIVDRNKILSVQSPEAYKFGKIQKAFFEGKKIQHAFEETCCSLYMYNTGKPLIFCEGNRYNLKIVRQEDLHMFEALLKMG